MEAKRAMVSLCICKTVFIFSIMRTARTILLLHPVFITSLLVLICNDCFWKYQYHNALTGKLSDVAGLMLLPIFLHQFFDNRKLSILFSVLFFTWWKSVLSQPVIDLFNDSLHIPLYRTIDYTDLFALPASLIVFFIQPYSYVPGKISRKICISVAGLGCLFAFCRTSTMRPRQELYSTLRYNEIRFYESFKTTKTKEEVLEKLQAANISYYEDSVRYYPVKQNIYYRVRHTNDSLQWVPVASTNDSTLFVKITSEKFYVIPQYRIDGELLENIEFDILPTGKKKQPFYVFVTSFRSEHALAFGFDYNSRSYKAYVRQFEKLFR
jgi:hypothetical protein